MRDLRRIIRAAGLWLAGCALAAHAQNATKRNPIEALDQFSDSVQALAAKVSPSVVQISVTRFAPREEPGGGRTGLVLGREQVVGSGVIIDPEGYIVTNAHVVTNALRIRVIRAAQNGTATNEPGETVTNALAQALAAPMDATLIGEFKEIDLALIKIPAKNLPALQFAD